MSLSEKRGFFGEITAADTDFDLSGGSRVDLAGSADDLVVDGSSGSQFDLENFSVAKRRQQTQRGQKCYHQSKWYAGC